MHSCFKNGCLFNGSCFKNGSLFNGSLFLERLFVCRTGAVIIIQFIFLYPFWICWCGGLSPVNNVILFNFYAYARGSLLLIHIKKHASASCEMRISCQ